MDSPNTSKARTLTKMPRGHVPQMDFDAMNGYNEQSTNSLGSSTRSSSSRNQFERDIAMKQKAGRAASRGVAIPRGTNNRNSIDRNGDDLVSIKIRSEAMRSMDLDARIAAKVQKEKKPVVANTTNGGSRAFLTTLQSYANEIVAKAPDESAHSDALFERIYQEKIRSNISNPSRNEMLASERRNQENKHIMAEQAPGPASRQNELDRRDDKVDSMMAALSATAMQTSKKPPTASLRDQEIPTSSKNPTVNTKLKNNDAKEQYTINGLNDGLVEQDLEYGEYGTENDNGLAVATAVVEDDDDKFIPAAVEYDPDAKPPMYKNRRFRLYAFLACFVLVVVIIGATVAVVFSSEADAGPQEPQLPYRETIGIKDQVVSVIGSDKLEGKDSPYVKALDWITHDDPMQIGPDSINFIQRYIAAYFYFATSVDRPWMSCTQPKGNETEDCDFIKLVQADPLETATVPWKRWLSNISECDWAGLFCNENEQIRAVEVAGMNLTGTFPEGLVYLTFLQSVNLAFGELTGTLPADIVKMKHLVNLELHGNMLEGTIPEEWWDSRSLQRINLAMNLLTGSIPSTISNLRDIKGLFMFTNLVSGSIPDEIADLKSLTYLRLQQNMLEGTIPTTLGPGQALNELMFQFNQLTGTIPPNIAEYTNLVDFRLHENQLSGVGLPDFIYNKTDIFRIDLYNNNFTGTISTAIGQLTNLVFFRISGNDFSGVVPSELGKLEGLEFVWLSSNNFFGQIPSELCTLRTIMLPGTNETQLVELDADCAVSNGTNLAQIVCPDSCCTTCCDPSGDVCFPMNPPGI